MVKRFRVILENFWKRLRLSNNLIGHMTALSIFLAITFLVFRKVVLSPGVIGMEGEWHIPPFSSQFKQMFEDTWYAWRSGEYGSPSYSPGLYYQLFPIMLAFIGMSGEAISKFISIMVMSLAGYSGFYLARQLNLKFGSSLVAGFSYMMTPVMYNRLCQGHLAIQFNYMLLPFVVAFFLKSILCNQKNGLKSSIVTGLLLGLITQPNEIIIGLTMLFLVSSLYIYKKDVSFRHFLKSLFITTFIACLIHAYLLIPLLSDIIETSLSGVLYTEMGQRPIKLISGGGYPLSDTLRLLRGPPYFDAALYSSTALCYSVWICMSFLFVLLSFTALLSDKMKRTALFSSFWVVVAVTLAAADKGPLGSMWFALVENFPPLLLFRTTVRWYPMAALGYAILLGVFFGAMSRKLGLLGSTVRKLRKSRLLPTSLFVWCMSAILIVYLIFFSMLVLYSFPFYTGDFSGSMHTFAFGQEYLDLFEWIHNEPEDFRVFMLPAPYPTLYDGASYISNPGYDMMSFYPGKASIYAGLIYYPQIESFLIKSMYENRSQHLSKLLGLSSVKYIIFDTGKRTLSTELSPWAGTFPEMDFTNEKIMNTINQQRDIQLVRVMDEANHTIYVFENNDYLPHLYSVSNIGLFAGDLTGLSSISYMYNLRLEETALIFVNQLSKEDFTYVAKLPNVKFVIQEGYFPDFMLTFVPKEYKLSPLEYLTSALPTDGWAMYEWIWYNWYHQAPLERVAFTMVPSELVVPYTAKVEGEYEIYLKAYRGTEGSSLEVYLDQAKLGHLYTEAASEVGLQWFYIGSTYLEPGSHELHIESHVGGENLVASIAIVPKVIMQNALEEVRTLMKDRQVILFSEADIQELVAPGEGVSLWDDDPLDLWTVGNLGEGQVGVPVISDEANIVKHGNRSLKLELPAGENGNAYLDYVFDGPQDWEKYDYLSFWWYGEDGGKLYVRVEDTNHNPREWRPEKYLDGWTYFSLPLQEPELTWGRPANLSDVVKLRIAKEEPGLWYLDNVELVVERANVEDVGVSTSEGWAIRIKRGTWLNQSFYVPKSGLYKLYIRAASDIPNSSLSLEVNKFEYSFTLSTGFGWIEAGEPYLDEGLTNVSFSPDMSSNVYLDQILLLSPQDSVVTSHPEINYDRITPVRYQLSGNSSKPFYIFFSERFQQAWKIFLDDGTEIRSFPGYSFGNLFYVNRTGQFSGTLIFERTKEYEIGKIISFATFGILITTIAVPTRLLIRINRSFIRKKIRIVLRR